MPSSLKGRPRRRACATVHREETHCWLCGNAVDTTLPRNHRWAGTVDEPLPRSYGGSSTDRANTRLAHRACNSSRGNQPITPEVIARCRNLYATAHGTPATPPHTRRW